MQLVRVPSSCRTSRIGSARAARPRACLFLLALFPLGALAQSQLDPVIVTGTREPQALSRSTGDIVVIDADTIRDSHGRFGRRPAAPRGRHAAHAQWRAGAKLAASSFAARAPTAPLVLIDGVRVGSASLGQAEFESLSLAQIDHIEVRRGPASSLYGADAVGGVVQIFTRRGEGSPRIAAARRRRRLQLAAGRPRHQRRRKAASTTLLAAGRERSDGVSAIRPNDQFGDFNPDHDGYGRNFGQTQLGYTPAPGHRIGFTLVETRLNAQFDCGRIQSAGLHCRSVA